MVFFASLKNPTAHCESSMSEVPSVLSCFRSSHFFVILQNFIMNASQEGLDKTNAVTNCHQKYRFQICPIGGVKI